MSELKVKVVARRRACHSYLSDDVALLDDISLLNKDGGLVSVLGLISVAMVDYDKLYLEGVSSCKGHDSVRCGVNLGASVSGDINALVV